jgi:hypothetical protein
MSSMMVTQTGRKKMTIAKETVINHKNGSQGYFIDQWNRTDDGKLVYEVRNAKTCRKTYWLADKCTVDAKVGVEFGDAQGVVGGVLRGGVVRDGKFNFHCPAPMSVSVDQVRGFAYV